MDASASQNCEARCDNEDVSGSPAEAVPDEASDTPLQWGPAEGEKCERVKRGCYDEHESLRRVKCRRLYPDAFLEKDSLQGLPSVAEAVASSSVAYSAGGAHADDGQEEAEIDDCSICLAPLANLNHQCTLPSCGHSFHTACILTTFCRSATSACPYCRGIGDLSDVADLGTALPDGADACNDAGGEDLPALQIGSDEMQCLARRIDWTELRPFALVMERLGRKDLAQGRRASAPVQQRPPRHPKSPFCSYGRQYIFGREEVRDRLPRLLRRMIAYVSRHLFVISMCEDKASNSVQEPGVVDDVQHMRQVDDEDDDGGGGDEVIGSGDSRGPTLFVEGISNGVHVRRARQGTWKWLPLGQAHAAGCGDRVAMLLEAPPGSFQPAGPRDYAIDAASAILFFEFA